MKEKNKDKEKDKKRPPKKITRDYLHNAGLYYLQRFAASTSHFRKIMDRKIMRSCAFHKDQDPDTCRALLDELIIRFQDAGLLDDLLYTKGMITSMRRRGLSARAIKSRLNIKGLATELVKEQLRLYDEQTQTQTTCPADLQAAIILARKKRIGPYAPAAKKHTNTDTETQNREKRRMLGIFARAGYSYDIAKKVMDMPPCT